MNWRFILIVALVIALNIWQQSNQKEPAPRRPLPEYVPEHVQPEGTGPLPGPSIFDPEIYVQLGKVKQSSSGTAFALDQQGWWMTARHVVDHCRAIQLRFPRNRIMNVKRSVELPDADLALLLTTNSYSSLPLGDGGQLNLGQNGFFVGYPQGVEGEVWGVLMGRMRMRISGRYSTHEPVLTWAEKARWPVTLNRLGGLSGAPALDSFSRVVGVVVAESRRRGRVYTAAPASIKRLRPRAPENRRLLSIAASNLRETADALRRQLVVANVVCFANLRRYRSY